MVASFVVPVNITAPSAVSADPGIMKWDTVSTPASIEGKNDVLNLHWQDPTVEGAVCNIYGYDQTGFGNEIIDMAVGNDGMTIYYIVRSVINIPASSNPLPAPLNGSLLASINSLYKTTNGGISATSTQFMALFRNPQYGFTNLYWVAVAPDDRRFIAVVAGDDDAISGAALANLGPCRIFVSTDGGANWEMAFDGTGVAGMSHIIDIDISIDYGGKRDIGFITDNGQVWVRQSSGFSGWTNQTLGALSPAPMVFYALKFSPSYSGDSALVLVYADLNGSYYNVALRDLSSTNDIVGWAFGTSTEIAVIAGDSPIMGQLLRACIQLPSDFSGQAASLRRAYISLDAHVAGTGFAPAAATDGIFRIDDTTVYLLMSTPQQWKSIYSIAYFGTYASGKLLAGERWGYPCTATVPTWFTDSPTTCPIPCWYPALKPTTGAANQGTCAAGIHDGVGAALVAWNADGSLSLVSTGSFTIYAAITWWYPSGLPGQTGVAGTTQVGNAATFALSHDLVDFDFTPVGGDNIHHALPPIPNDESAFAISRNNGETWNQLSLIDTTIDWFNDVAIAPDCTTIYLASANRNTFGGTAAAPIAQCNEFDSVWRATINPNVAAPLPAVPPLGTYWERVYCRVTAGSCNVTQSDLPILRLVPSCTDKPDGEIVGWAAQEATATRTTTTGVMAWSPDFGDYWANVTPRFVVQDFAFESSSTIYVLSAAGLVQRLPYTGTSWPTNLNSYDTVLSATHTIVAVPDGKVLVGGAVGSNSEFPVAYSADKGVTFMQTSDAIIGHGNEHVIFDVDFKNNSFIYMGDDAQDGMLGTVYRNTLPSFTRWVDNDMMSIGNNASGIDWPEGTVGPPHPVGIFGLAQAWTGSPDPAVYAAHDNITNTNFMWDSGVCRTLAPRDGMPKPGISWDCLDVFAPINTIGVLFTLEPTSLKYCGCCTLDTNTTLYAIDDERGAVVTTTAPLIGRWNNHRNDCTEPWDDTWAGYTPKLRQGMLWAYTDCLAKRGPVLKGPADGFLVGADPVTGRNQQIDLSWEQLCLATGYLIQIAKDEDFTLKIDPTLNNATTIGSVIDEIQIDMDATNMTSPAVWIAPGALPEAGAIYYWRVCVYRSATGQLAWSDWSETRSFTVKAGFIVNTPYYGVQLLAPNNGCIGCKVKPASFSWSPWKETTKYQFDLAKDPEFKSVVVTATAATTGYEYDGTLDYSTNYFWRVKALQVNGQNIPSDWSATFSLQTEAAPEPPATVPAEPATPLWVWVIIAIGAIFVITVLMLVMRIRSK